jgi:hypothetical protein
MLDVNSLFNLSQLGLEIWWDRAGSGNSDRVLMAISGFLPG